MTTNGIMSYIFCDRIGKLKPTLGTAPDRYFGAEVNRFFAAVVHEVIRF
jgi:hypothetical protein